MERINLQHGPARSCANKRRRTALHPTAQGPLVTTHLYLYPGAPRALERVERLLERGNQVLRVLDAARDAHEAVGDAHLVVVARVRVRVRVGVVR